MKLFCYKCGIVDTALVNGYDFGDRLLENVKFEVEVDKNKLSSKQLHLERDKRYCQQLDMVYWFKKANEYLEDILADGVPLECTKCFDYTVETIEDDPEEKVEKKKSSGTVKIYKGKTLLSDYEAAGG